MSQTTPLQQILRKLKSVFPEAVTETEQKDDDGKPCYTYALKQEFIDQLQGSGLDIANDQNRYELQFPGKQTAKAAVLTPCHKTLIADREQSKNFDDTGNVFIEGDNLDALRMLQKSYRGKIKVIYIDPPYNTGNDDFVYNDDFSVKQKEYLQAAGVLDEDGVRQISEIQTGLKGRFHAGWLAFMYPRLKLARELLSNDGVIFISIDDNEQANLKLICDEVFGEENFVGNIAWKKNTGDNKPNFAFTHDNIFIYGKNPNVFPRQPLTKEQRQQYSNPDNDPRGDWAASDYRSKWTKQERKNLYYAITNPHTKEEIYPDSHTDSKRVWGSNPESHAANERNGLVWWGKDGKSKEPKKKRFLSQHKGTNTRSIWLDVGTNEDASKMLRNMFTDADKVFDNAKPVMLIKNLIRIILQNDGVALDFFAGSATTAHAVMQLNAEDGGNRKFILVQLPEKIDPKKSKEAHEFCANELKRPATIAEIAKERIRRAGTQLATESPATDIDTGFRAFVIQDSLLSNSEQQPLTQTKQDEMTRYLTELKPENFDPILYEALLKTGAPLHLPIVTDEVDGYPFAICDRRCYCVTKNLSQKIVQAITDKHAKAFDILYYLSDTLNAKTSYTEIETVIHQTPGDKQVQGLAFY